MHVYSGLFVFNAKELVTQGNQEANKIQQNLTRLQKNITCIYIGILKELQQHRSS